MSRMLFIWGILLLSWHTLAETSSDKLEIVTLQYPPYVYRDDEKVSGVAVDIIQEAFSRMQQPITIHVLPWARAIYQIRNGDSDAIFTIYKTPERELFADFSSEILISQTISLFVQKNSSIVFDGDIKSLSRYSFGAARKISYGNLFDNAVEKRVLSNLALVNTEEQVFKMLIAGRLDIVVSNKFGASDILKQISGQEKVRELIPTLQTVPSYIAFSKKRNLSAIRNKFDLTLKQMKTDGSYHKIIQKYFH